MRRRASTLAPGVSRTDEREAHRRRAERGGSALRKFLHDNGLSLALFALFVVSIAGQIVAGLRAYNEERRDHGQPEVTLSDYVRDPHFTEATAENWESEFLQMGAYVLLTAFLFQRGSAESNDPDGKEPKRPPPAPRERPWAVRRGGVTGRIYEHSLSLAFALLFLASFALHAVAGAARYSAEQVSHGGAPVPVWTYLHTAQFWFESFQNWQSEFLAILSMVVLTIWLRQKHSPESKEVEAPHSATGK